ncbi:hypothetical protein ACFVRB_08305, partial [Streptomyces nojiriensis]|uniref:hypothetical protein n=1 Tax=Streptomyces nojiriensis TaxID=66374 RepID=UPI0036DDC696
GIEGGGGHDNGNSADRGGGHDNGNSTDNGVGLYGKCQGEGGPGQLYEVGGVLVCSFDGRQDRGSQEVQKGLQKNDAGVDADQLWTAFKDFVGWVNIQRMLQGLPPLKGLPGVSFAVWSTQFNLCLHDFSCVIKHFPQLLEPSQQG